MIAFARARIALVPQTGTGTVMGAGTRQYVIIVGHATSVGRIVCS